MGNSFTKWDHSPNSTSQLTKSKPTQLIKRRPIFKCSLSPLLGQWHNPVPRGDKALLASLWQGCATQHDHQSQTGAALRCLMLQDAADLNLSCTPKGWTLLLSGHWEVSGFILFYLFVCLLNYLLIYLKLGMTFRKEVQYTLSFWYHIKRHKWLENCKLDSESWFLLDLLLIRSFFEKDKFLRSFWIVIKPQHHK